MTAQINKEEIKNKEIKYEHQQRSSSWSHTLIHLLVQHWWMRHAGCHDKRSVTQSHSSTAVYHKQSFIKIFIYLFIIRKSMLLLSSKLYVVNLRENLLRIHVFMFRLSLWWQAENTRQKLFTGPYRLLLKLPWKA